MRSFRLAAVCLAVVGTCAPAGAGTPLTLPEAIGAALRTNPALAAAEGRESAAWAGVDRTGAERWPQLRLDSQLAHVSEVATIRLPIPGAAAVSLGDQDTWVSTASVQQLLFSGGRVSSLVRQAGRGAEAARASRRRVRQAVAFGAERAFLLLLAAQGETGVAAETLAAAESHLKVAGAALAARAAARFDVLRAEVQVEEARQDVIRAEGARAGAHAALLQAIGLPDGDFRAVAPEPPAPGRLTRPGPEPLVAEALRQRPDVQALQGQVDAAAAGVAAVRAERLPTLAALADYRYATPESQLLFSRWSVGASLSLPVLDGGRIAARRAEAEAALVQAAAARDALMRAVEAEVRQAAARLASADAQVLVAERRVAQAEELARIAEVRYEGGAGTATEVADAQASLARARYGRTRAGAEQGVAAAELAFAAGATATEPATGASAPAGGAAGSATATGALAGGAKQGGAR